MRKPTGHVAPALAGVLLTSFVTALGLGAVASPEPKVSLLDGRQLRSFPEPRSRDLEDGSWMAGVEEWVDDHVPGRRTWLNLYAGIASRGLRAPVIKNVYVGDPAGMQLEKLPPYRVPDSLGRNAELLGEQVRAAGSQVLFVYVPRKEEVFADRLPAAWPNSLDESKEQVLESLSRGGPVLDLTTALSEPDHRDKYFWRTDHHWTPAGVFVALDEITKKAAEQGVRIPEDDRAYTAKAFPDFYGSTARKTTAAGTRVPDRFAVPTPPKWEARACVKGVCNRPTFVKRIAEGGDEYTNRYAAFLGGDYGYQPLLNRSKKGSGSILMLKDSLGNSLSTYLAERVEKVVTIDERKYGGAEIRDVVARDHPDLVIVMHNQATMLGNRQFDSRVWVDVKAAVAARRQGDG